MVFTRIKKDTFSQIKLSENLKPYFKFGGQKTTVVFYFGELFLFNIILELVPIDILLAR